MWDMWQEKERNTLLILRKILPVRNRASEICNSPFLAQKVMNEALKYQGWKYVYGGSNPNTSFDCSGLTQWCYGKAGISLPRTAQAQYDATQHLPLSQAKAGDLVFFHSTYNAGSYVTHVGILVSPTQMYHAGNPIGYADLSSSYWQQHLIGAGRVKQ